MAPSGLPLGLCATLASASARAEAVRLRVGRLLLLLRSVAGGGDAAREDAPAMLPFQLHAARVRLAEVSVAASMLAGRMQQHASRMKRLKRLLSDAYDPRRVNLVATYHILLDLTRYRAAALQTIRAVHRERRAEGLHATPLMFLGPTVDGGSMASAVAFLEGFANDAAGLTSLFIGILAFHLRDFHACARTRPEVLVSCVQVHVMHDACVAHAARKDAEHRAAAAAEVSTWETAIPAPAIPSPRADEVFRLPPIDLGEFDGQLGSASLWRLLRRACWDRARHTIARAHRALAEEDEESAPATADEAAKRSLEVAVILADEALENAELMGQMLPPERSPRVFVLHAYAAPLRKHLATVVLADTSSISSTLLLDVIDFATQTDARWEAVVDEEETNSNNSETALGLLRSARDRSSSSSPSWVPDLKDATRDAGDAYVSRATQRLEMYVSRALESIAEEGECDGDNDTWVAGAYDLLRLAEAERCAAIPGGPVVTTAVAAACRSSLGACASCVSGIADRRHADGAWPARVKQAHEACMRSAAL